MNINTFIEYSRRNLFSPHRVIDAIIHRRDESQALRTTELPGVGEIHVLLPDVVSTMLYLHRTYEREVSTYLNKRLRPGMTFLDIGANVGYHSIMASNIVGSSGRVVAFEPIRELYEVLKLNAPNHGNITTEQKAVGDGESTEMLLEFYGIRWASQSTPKSLRMTKSQRTKLVYPEYRKSGAISIDDYVQSKEIVPNVIKIDIEGGETDALKGSKRVIDKYYPDFIVEVGDFDQDSKSNGALQILRKAGYSLSEFNFRTSKFEGHQLRDRYQEATNIFASNHNQ